MHRHNDKTIISKIDIILSQCAPLKQAKTSTAHHHNVSLSPAKPIVQRTIRYKEISSKQPDITAPQFWEKCPLSKKKVMARTPKTVEKRQSFFKQRRSNFWKISQANHSSLQSSLLWCKHLFSCPFSCPFQVTLSSLGCCPQKKPTIPLP